MKKTILLLLSFGLFALAACDSAQPGNEAKQTTASEQVTQIQTEARPPRPMDKEEQLKWLACEFQYRMLMARIEGKEQDLSDIIDENDDMLFWQYQMRIDVEMYKVRENSRIEAIVNLYSGPLEILKETDAIIVANTYIQTVYRYVGMGNITGGVATGKTTFKKDGDRYIIADYESGDKGNMFTKSIVDKYVKQGMSKAEANKKLYEEEMELLRKQSATSSTT